MSVPGHIAAIRFGLGLRLGEAPPADPEAWLLRQIDHPGPPPEGTSVQDGLRMRAEEVAGAATGGTPVPRERTAGQLMRGEAIAFGRRHLTTEQPFLERLVDFWMNHFTVNRRGVVAAVAVPAMEREAIRPHLLGRFPDMVVAVARHPAMLTYLSNASSIGPRSRVGQRTNRGLNENLAREVLELHTLSPAGGYTQGDVEEFAKILTGWSVAARAEPYGYVFQAGSHEPGPKQLLGRRFGEGEAQGEAALRFLAEHPATWRHLATKLARHFVADQPPPEAVRVLEVVLRDTKGDLAATARALVKLPQAWDPPLGKFRAPLDYVVAAGRALGLDPERGEAIPGGSAALGQTIWTAPQPNGWPDTMGDWAAPEALMRRVDWAYTMAGRMSRADLGAVAEAALGPLGRAETVTEIGRAGSVRDGLTLLLGSPEFMRR